MKTHWLKLGGLIPNNLVTKQYDNLNRYLKAYPGSKVTYYTKDSDIYSMIVKLECDQSYSTLDLDCNSGFDGSIKRLYRKPSGITITDRFNAK